MRACLLSSLAYATAAVGASTSCGAGNEVCSVTEGGQSATAMLQARSNIRSSSVNTGSSNVLDANTKDAGLEAASLGSKADANEKVNSSAKAVEDAVESSRQEATAAAQAAIATAADEAAVEAAQRAKVAQQAAAYLKVKHRRMEYEAHMAQLTKAMAEVNVSQHPSQTELDNMLQHFSDNQAASQDKCPALLLEAKHQLNVIHEHIHELAIEINVTEQSLVSEHTQIETTYEMINNTHAWKVEEALKCKAKKEENWKMYWILKAELLEMHQIANPSFQANYDYSAWALKHDFSAKTHTIVSTSSFAASSTSATSSTSTATGASTSGFINTGTSFSTSGFMNTGHSTGISTGIGHSSGFMNSGYSGFSNNGFSTSGFMNGYGFLQKDNAGKHSQQEASLLQAEAQAEDEPITSTSAKDPARVAKARAMVQQTKELAKQLSACMAEKQPEKPVEPLSKTALLEESALPDFKQSDIKTDTKSSISDLYPAFEQSKNAEGASSGTYFHTSNTGSGFSSNFNSGGWNSAGVYTGYGYGHGTGSSTGYTTGHSSSAATTTGSVYHSASSYHSSSKVHSSSHSSLSKYTTSSTGTWGSSKECQWQKQSLQVIYIRAYIELTRLLAQYEVIIHEHTCDDWVLETEGQQEKILEAKVVKMTTTVSSFTHKLEAYHMRLEGAYRIEVQLRAHIKILIKKCGEMDATVSSLDKVRDAIQIMGVCPGLGRLSFNLPRFTGQLLTASFDTLTKTDEEIDQEMNALCAANRPTVDWANLLQMSNTFSPVKYTYIFRAAETSEIMLRSIEDMPYSNEASIPVMGPCPNCEGADDADDGPQHASGHFRVCWDPEAVLSATTKRTDCTAGRKAVMCVAEQTYNANQTIIITR